MTALPVTHGSRWASLGLDVGLRLALGSDIADGMRPRGAAMLAVLPRRR